MAPQPACVTGPRQAVPCATITHTVPRRLHSRQTLWARTRGRRRFRWALITSSSCCLLIGHPCNSKSTATLALIGVEVARVEMYSGVAYTALVNSWKIGGAGYDGE